MKDPANASRVFVFAASVVSILTLLVSVVCVVQQSIIRRELSEVRAGLSNLTVAARSEGLNGAARPEDADWDFEALEEAPVSTPAENSDMPSNTEV